MLEETTRPEGYTECDPVYFYVTATTYEKDGVGYYDLVVANGSVVMSDSNRHCAFIFNKNGSDGEYVVSSDNKLVATVQNLRGDTLPSTGGVGTTLFYVIGAILVIGAGVVLVTKRRVNGEN